LLLALAACRGDEADEDTSGGETTSRGIPPWEDGGRCETEGDGRFVTEYDTTGDGRPDVRKVFLAAGAGTELGSVLVCREVDVDGDGTKDVFRFYHDEGEPFREEADRDFDGTIDERTTFVRGQMSRRDVDADHDGRFDTRTYYEHDLPVRTERDTAGRSTETEWHPDRWEYYAEGRLIRMGVDLDGDGTADRWDRDPDYHAPDDEEAEAAAPAETTDAAPEGDAPEGDAPAEGEPTEATAPEAASPETASPDR
jgi:hypothetical protein